MSRLTIFGLGVLAVLAADAADAQRRGRKPREPEEDYLDRSPALCISLMRLRDTTIVDDHTILFYLSGGDVYLNTLDRTCHGLESSGRFMTETRSNRLCEADMVQVLRQFAGEAYPTMYCRLGEFHPITGDEAALLELEPEELAAVRRSVVLTPLEAVALPAEVDAEASPDAAASGAEPVPATGLPADPEGAAGGSDAASVPASEEAGP